MKTRVKALKNGRWSEGVHLPQIEAIAGAEYEIMTDLAEALVLSGSVEILKDSAEPEKAVEESVPQKKKSKKIRGASSPLID